MAVYEAFVHGIYWLPLKLNLLLKKQVLYKHAASSICAANLTLRVVH
jgi:hypothetical protein